ncbi:MULTISPECIES: HAD-IB family hydrolase [Streptomyces]
MSGARPAYLVFSDVDETLITAKSMLDFLDHYFPHRYGRRGALKAARVRADLAGLLARGACRAEANRRFYRAWRGEPAAAVHALAARWFAARAAGPGFFVEPTLAALREHVRRGADVVLVSGSFPAVLTPLAEQVGARRVLCSTPRVHRGVYTGALLGAPMIGEAKRGAVRALLAEHPDVRAAHCYAYGDHVSDLPMLTEVGHPVQVGDDPVLRAHLTAAA